jgi:hypothetical protein
MLRDKARMDAQLEKAHIEARVRVEQELARVFDEPSEPIVEIAPVMFLLFCLIVSVGLVAGFVRF